ncbi:MAG: LPS assembly lipoprotein LptE [Lentisphaeria bacterium]|nr:LPS assembly lipoprotein LptE [Lentisphaeria bacterium]
MKTMLAAAAAAILLSSCARYHFGTALPETRRQIAVMDVMNLTQEDALAPLLNNALREHIMNTPGLKLTGENDATLAVSVKITTLTQSRVARAQTRDSKARHSESDSYQTVLYRLEMTCEYTAQTTRENLIPKTGSVTASADVPLMQDIALPQQAELKQLARKAAAKILAEITEE